MTRIFFYIDVIYRCGPYYQMYAQHINMMQN